MEGDFAGQTDSESSPKAEADRLKLSDDASISETSPPGKGLGRKASVDFDNILDTLTVNESEFDSLPNVAGAVSELLLPKDSFASSFAPQGTSFKGSLDDVALEDQLDPGINDAPLSSKNAAAEAEPNPKEEEGKREALRKVSLEEMMIEAGQPIFQPIPIEELKMKKEPKASKKKLQLEKVEPELILPPIVGTKPGKKPTLDTGASALRLQREDKVDLKLPAQSVQLSSKKKITRSRTKLSSQEAEDLPIKKRSESILPELPHTSPAETKREKKRKQKPLYMRMQEKVKLLVAEEERLKHEEYLRQKNQRAKGHYNKEEIKEHIKQHDELMKKMQTEAKHNHVSQVRALKNKSRDVPDGLNSSSFEEQASLGSIDSHKPTKSKHRKQLEDYDAVAYKVEDSAKDRKRKHKKLMEMISPRQNHSSGDGVSAEDDMESINHLANMSEEHSSTPRVKDNTDGDVNGANHPQQELFSPFSDDLDAFNDLAAASLEARPPQQDKLQSIDILQNDSFIAKPEKVFVDPFIHVDSSIKMTLDNNVIPTYIDNDWVTMLHSDGDNDQETLLLVS